MVTKSRFTYLSRDGIHKCQAYKWQNDNVPVKHITDYSRYAGTYGTIR